MTRSLRALVLFGAFAFGACTPRDPLEWKVSSATPNDFNEWSDRTSERLPPEVRRELAQAILFLRGDSGLAANPRSMFETHNELCLRTNGKTIRQVILEGYHVEKVFLLSRFSLEADHLARNVKNAELFEGTPEKMKNLAAAKAYQEQSIDEIKTRLAEIEARVAVLSPEPR